MGTVKAKVSQRAEEKGTKKRSECMKACLIYLSTLQIEFRGWILSTLIGHFLIFHKCHEQLEILVCEESSSQLFDTLFCMDIRGSLYWSWWTPWLPVMASSSQSYFHFVSLRFLTTCLQNCNSCPATAVHHLKGVTSYHSIIVSMLLLAFSLTGSLAFL